MPTYIDALRLAAAGFHHESNTFAGTPASWEVLEAGADRGDGIITKYATSHATMAGYLETADEPGVAIEPLVFWDANPSGPISGDAYERMTGEILERLGRCSPDAVLLAQHGAAVADGEHDADGHLVQRVREWLGDTPIGVTVDMHANISRRLFESADVLVAYQTNPHVDPRDRARHCANLVLSTLRGTLRPASAFVRVPVALHIACQDTSAGPVAALLALTRETEREHGLVSASLVEGFPYADVPQLGMSVVTIADADEDRARDAAVTIADAVWARRHELSTTLPSPVDALRQASASSGTTLVLDVGDNIGGGSSGDSTALLHEAVRLGVSSLFQTVHDARSAARAIDAGVGARVEIAVGGRLPGSPAPPLPTVAEVLAVSDGRYEDPTAVHGGFRFFDAGPSAAVRTAHGHTLLLHSRLVMPTSLEQLRHIGVDPREFQIVVAKGVNSPKAAYRRVTDRMIYADTPGVTSADLHHLDYRRRPELHPFEDLDWNARDHVVTRGYRPSPHSCAATERGRRR